MLTDSIGGSDTQYTALNLNAQAVTVTITDNDAVSERAYAEAIHVITCAH